MFKRMLVLGAAALFLGAAVRLTAVPSPAVADPAAQKGGEAAARPASGGRPRWETLWHRAAPHVTSCALAPDGSSVAWVDRAGAVRRIQGATGRTLWQTDALPGINRVCVGPQGAVLAYSRLNPSAASVRILDPAVGARKSALVPLDGAVWRACLSPDGRQAVIGTGKASLYVVPMRRDAVVNGPAVKLPGIPESIAVAAGEPVALLGTWQEGGVCAWGLDRSPRWRRAERTPARAYEVHISADGSTAVAVSSEGPRRGRARLHAWDARTGALLFIEDLDGFTPRAAVSANGRYIAVTYGRHSEYGSGSGMERKVGLFDRTGRRSFADRGGIYFSPELVCLSATGDRLTVRDPSGMLWTLDRNGRTVARLRLPAERNGLPLRDVIATEDGAYLLALQGDGKASQLTLLKAAQ